VLFLSAFWWIAGDCLGFRRQSGISSSTGKPYKFASSLRYGVELIKTYEEQKEIFCTNGFAMWDVIQSCKREGSLDQDIKEDLPNDIRSFCKDHPFIRRIVLANGGTGAQFFRKHFKDWFDSGEIIPGENEASQAAFKKWVENDETKTPKESPYFSKKIVVISALAVSPAAARYSYEEKRDFWEERVYKPGLADHRKNTRAIVK
jgi:hypoxanthine-DNA glycosylase